MMEQPINRIDIEIGIEMEVKTPRLNKLVVRCMAAAAMSKRTAAAADNNCLTTERRRLCSS
jgi:hypothetical protein